MTMNGSRSSACPGATRSRPRRRGDLRDGKTLVALLWLAGLRSE